MPPFPRRRIADRRHHHLGPLQVIKKPGDERSDFVGRLIKGEVARVENVDLRSRNIVSIGGGAGDRE